MKRVTSLVILLLLVGSCAAVLIYNHRKTMPPTPSPRSGTSEKAATAPNSPSVTIYFQSKGTDQTHLVPVVHPLPSNAPLLQSALQELLSGEVPQNCERPVPKGVKLLSTRINGNIAFVDLSREVMENFSGGVQNEALLVYAIVNTANSVPGVQKTQLLVEGKKVDSIGGHLEASEPLASHSE
jgi:germination protein M